MASNHGSSKGADFRAKSHATLNSPAMREHIATRSKEAKKLAETARLRHADHVISGRTYDMRDELKRVGAKYDAGSKTWTAKGHQVDTLREMAERSFNRFNKRDRALGVAWHASKVEPK